MRAWQGPVTVMGVEVLALGTHCAKCGETLFHLTEVQRQELVVAGALVARGIRSSKEFRFVRKIADLRANELASILGVTPETVSRWESGKLAIPKLAAFALGELFDHPKLARQKLERLAS